MKSLPLFLAIAGIATTGRTQDSLPAQTVVVFNRALPESAALARFYVEKRGIAGDHVVGLDCSREEEITRDEYETTIAGPLREAFTEHKWWQIADAADGKKRTQMGTIHFVALIKGIPLKIKSADQPGDNPSVGPIQNRNEASVDSELSALGFFAKEISGALNNPYFQSYRPVAELSAPILLVCRLDAPDAATVRRMITDAVEVEKAGLWGRAVVDGAHNTSGGLAVGDTWLSTIVEQLHKAGIPVIYDEAPETLPDAFPVSDCALYYGWYAGGIGGPFNQPGFEFMPGAVAAHIHSYSASTLRDPNAGWAGPLLIRGAAATVGNVYEPYLQLTTNLEILNDRLLHGFTFAESVYMGTRVLSWMNVALGDPLYRPYLNWIQIDPKRDGTKATADWRAYHDFAVKNSALVAPDFRAQARIAAVRARNAPMMEDVGLMELHDGNFANAITCLQTARSSYAKRDDIMRCVVEECGAWMKSGKPKRALELARSILRLVPDSPAAQMLRRLEKNLTAKPVAPAATPMISPTSTR